MAPVGDLWRRQGARLAYEVPVYERFLDIVAVQEQTRVVAIELKIRDWRKALQQAVVAQLVADEVYIAICIGTLLPWIVRSWLRQALA